MSNTGLDVFDSTISKTNELFHEVELALGWQGKRQKTYDAVRAVLQTLRDRLTVEEAAQFAAQLPMLVRGFFYEGWDPSIVPVKMNKYEFLEVILDRADFPPTSVEDAEHMVHVIFEAVKSFVNNGEIEDVKHNLPGEIAALI